VNARIYIKNIDMGFFNRKKDNELNERKYELDNPFFLGSYTTAYSKSINKNSYLKLATVNRCVELITNAVASLPLNPYIYKENWKYINYDTPLYNLLNIQPNQFMSAFTFKKLIVQNMLLFGNAYILISRNGSGVITNLEVLNSNLVTPEIRENNLVYVYRGKKQTVVFSKDQIIHLLNQSDDGIVGKSVLEYAADTLQIASKSEQAASNWFSGAMSGLLSPKAGINMSAGAATKAKESIVNNLSNNPNSILLIDTGFDFTPINHSAKEVQLLESRNFNIVMIASFFGVPPSLAFSQDQKFSTAEQEQLSFLNNTLTPLLEKIESEFFRKLFLPSEFNVSDLKFDIDNLMRLDAVSKADYFTKLYQIGAFTTNEIRERLNSNSPVKGGNRAFNQVNLQPLDNLISEQVQTTDQSKQIDNKLKQ
jgi:HK97 family phage portal protein